MTTPLRVLIVEDRLEDVELMLDELRRAGFEPAWQRVETPDDYLFRLDPGLDVILCDYYLPEFDALRALQLLQERVLDIPFLVVTGSRSEEVAVECMKQGAADYLLKDRLVRLGPALTRALEQKQLRAAQRQAEKQLRAALQEKETLLRELQHRVKNNLQVVDSLLNLQAERIDDRQARALVRNCQMRVKAMALVHDKLSYRYANVACIHFTSYLRSLVSHLALSSGIVPGTVALKLDVADEVFLDITAAYPCGLIVTELVANALRHAFPAGRKGEIWIKLRVDDDRRLMLTIGDNGIGFPKDLDFRTVKSLGLELVNILAEQIDAAVVLNRQRGTTFTVTFAGTPARNPAQV